MFGITTKKAIAKLQKELKNDAEYRKSWEDNISVCIQDTAVNMGVGHRRLHLVADEAAKNFIDLLISK